MKKNRKYPVKDAAKKSKRQKVMGKIVPKVNVMNCYPTKRFKVISVPKDWPDPDPARFMYLNRIGTCCGTDRLYGAKLRFDTGETVSIPFEVLEAVDQDAPMEPVKTIPTPTAPVVAEEVELAKDNYYKLIRKPTNWKEGCKYVGQTGKCILVDARGARLRFSDGCDISFLADVLEMAPAIDLSNVIPQGELDEDDIIKGELYIVHKAPEKYGEGKKLLGKVGKAKWINYRGVCLKFPDNSAYVIPYDCLARYTPPAAPNPVPVSKKLNATSIVIGRKYKVKSVPGDWKEVEKRYAIGQFAIVTAATDLQGGRARMLFDNNLEKWMPFDCIEDLPRPTEDELIALIKQYPGKLLQIIKQINNATRLKPVKDFCSTGLLPYCKEEATTVHQPSVTVYGPQLPQQHSTALMMHTTVGSASEKMMRRVVSMINADEAAEN